MMSEPNQITTPASTNEAPGQIPPVQPSNQGALEPTPPSKMPKFSKKWPTAGLVILVILAAGGYLLHKQNAPANTTNKTSKVYKIGILDGLDVLFKDNITGFKQKMAQLGYVEGKNVVYDIQITPTPVGNLSVAKKLVQDKNDLIVAFPTEASQDAKAATKGTGIPVISLDSSIEGANLVDSVQHPGANITGVRYPAPEVSAKRLEILNQLAPTAKRIWLPYQKDYPNVPGQLLTVQAEAKTLGLTVTEAPFATAAELKTYLDSLPASGDVGMDAILEIAEPQAGTPDSTSVIFKFADSHSLPIAGAIITADASGPMFELAPDSKTVGQLAAPLAVKIFKGTPAGGIPMITPPAELQINLLAIQRLGLSANEGLLSTATKIVK